MASLITVLLGHFNEGPVAKKISELEFKKVLLIEIESFADTQKRSIKPTENIGMFANNCFSTEEKAGHEKYWYVNNAKPNNPGTEQYKIKHLKKMENLSRSIHIKRRGKVIYFDVCNFFSRFFFDFAWFECPKIQTNLQFN